MPNLIPYNSFAPDKPIIWSFGGGVQSAAIAVLVVSGRLPVPDRVVMADTGREATETWEYLNEVINPYLAQIDRQVEIAPHSLATVDLYSGNGDVLIPAYTESGALRGFCSNEWKKRVVERWMRAEGYGPKKPVRVWLGISTNEADRMKDSGVAWVENWYPLIMDLRLDRQECIWNVEKAGLPTPPRSACWMCPYRSNPEWERLKSQYPEDFAKAVDLDEAMRERDSLKSLYVHKSRQPLRDVDLELRNMPLIDLCDSGYCWT